MLKIIGSAAPEYLAATDLLIGDMSSVVYEFLLYDRPVILLASNWVRQNFPDLGIKSDLVHLDDAIIRSIRNPDEFKKQRHLWLKKTIYKPDGQNSKRYIDIMLKKSQITKPHMVFIHGNNSVRKTNLEPLINEVKLRALPFSYVASVKKRGGDRNNVIFVGAHFRDLNILGGYKVHIDHDLKGKGTTNIEMAIRDYKKYNFFPWIDLHITAGEAGDERTKKVLGPLKDRTVIAGYPKADYLIKLNTFENKKQVFNELGFFEDRLLITYAPAGKQSYAKPGGSLCPEVIKKLREINMKNDYNILVKLKHPKGSIGLRIINKVTSWYRLHYEYR